jgi:hypothetical protein
LFEWTKVVNRFILSVRKARSHCSLLAVDARTSLFIAVCTVYCVRSALHILAHLRSRSMDSSINAFPKDSSDHDVIGSKIYILVIFCEQSVVSVAY